MVLAQLLLSYCHFILYFLYGQSDRAPGKGVCNSGAGGCKGPCRPLDGVRGVPASLPHPAAEGGAKEKRPEELQEFFYERLC